MAKSDPARETALLTPDAVPARSDSTEVRTRVVNGAIARLMPSASNRMGGGRYPPNRSRSNRHGAIATTRELTCLLGAWFDGDVVKFRNIGLAVVEHVRSWRWIAGSSPAMTAARHRATCADTASHFPFCFAQQSV